MRVSAFLTMVLSVFGAVARVNAQSADGSDDRQVQSGGPAAGANAKQLGNVRKWFDASGLKIGDAFPSVDIFDAGGKPFNTRSLKGRHAVLVSGCLT